MRRVAALSLLLAGVLADRADNFLRIENGQVVGHGFANDLKDMPTSRSSPGHGSGDDGNVFNGQIGITDALNPNSPLSQWMDELLNPESDPYKQAVVQAMKILLTVLLMALGGLGIDTFTILILGFSEGSVLVDFALQVDANQGEGIQASDIGTALSETITNNNDAIDGFQLDNSVTELQESDETIVIAQCADCWVPYDSTSCVPDPTKLTLECRADGIQLALDQCIMGMTDLNSLSLDSPDCGGSSSAVQLISGQYVAFTPLDGCSTQMNFNGDHIEFTNHLQGNFMTNATGPESIISTYDRYSVGFTCDYATTYEDIGTSTDVVSSLQSGPVQDGEGALAFTLETYTDATFSTKDDSGVVRVGTTLNFAIEITSPINNVDFTVTDCTVKNSDQTLSYEILTGRCPNSRVKFNIFNNQDTERVTFSYTVFEFKNDNAATLHLSCNIIVCQADDTASTCASDTSCSRRKRRSFDENETYYRVSKDMTSV
jgi:hypothetical protein